MPHLELHDTPGAPRYRLDGEPLVDGDSIELWTMMGAGWMRGRFRWNGDLAEEPWFQTTSYGHRLTPVDELRRVEIESAPPPVERRGETAEVLKDWERRSEG